MKVLGDAGELGSSAFETQYVKNSIKWIPRSGIDLLSAILALACFGLVIVMIVVSSGRELTSLEEILFQVVILATGISASWRIGRSSALRNHARPVFRRVLDIHIGLYNLSDMVQGFKTQRPDPSLDVIDAVVSEQLRTARSAIEDWRDISPEDVEDIEVQARESQNDNPS